MRAPLADVHRPSDAIKRTQRRRSPFQSRLRRFDTSKLRIFTFGSALGVMLFQAPVIATTPAGTRIVNVAGASFDQGGGAGNAASNTASLVVIEELGVTLARIDDGTVHAGAGRISAIPFVLTNAGNGHEAFALSGAITGIDGQVTGFAIDRNGDGRFDADVDTVITDGSTPMLDAGGGIRLLAFLRSTSTDGQGTLTIATHAVTGSGHPGTVFAAMGDGGVDAIVGPTTAAASIDVPIAAAADATTATLVKSQTVRAPDGSDRPVHGATITYSIAARFDGTALATGSVLSDPIPDGTDYVPGSLRLNSTALTDAADGDAGQFTGGDIQVALGDVVAPATDTISFQVTIQ